MKRLTLIFALILALIVLLADQGLGSAFFSFAGRLPGGDKAGHFILAGLFSFLMNMSLHASRLRIGRLRILKGSLIVAIIVTLEELSQLFFATRSCSLSDLMFDYAGIFLCGRVALYLASRSSGGT